MWVSYIADPDLPVLENLEDSLSPNYHGGHCKDLFVFAACEFTL